MRNIVRLLFCGIIIIFVCSSCSLYNEIKFHYSEWREKQRDKAFQKYEMPPIDQLVYKVDTIYIEHPVVIRDKYNLWIINAPVRPLNDKTIRSIMTDSVTYILDNGLSLFALPHKSKKYANFVDYDIGTSFKLKYQATESSSKYKVYDYESKPKYFVLYLFNARYYKSVYSSLDLEPTEINNLVKNYSNTYVTVAFPVKSE